MDDSGVTEGLTVTTPNVHEFVNPTNETNTEVGTIVRFDQRVNIDGRAGHQVSVSIEQLSTDG
jgi:hypothetical protein